MAIVSIQELSTVDGAPILNLKEDELCVHLIKCRSFRSCEGHAIPTPLHVFVITLFMHFYSIGSLGRRGNFVQVENIHVSNVQFKHTTNGARIKTWQVMNNECKLHSFIFLFYLNFLNIPLCCCSEGREGICTKNHFRAS